MKLFMRLWMIGLLALITTACANGVSTGASSNSSHDGSTAWTSSGPDYFPGGAEQYGFGGGQTKENFENIEVAQYAYTMKSSSRSWGNVTPTRSPYANMLGLFRYYPLHFRWKLKDGREFILENIDLRPIMREYFKTHQILNQWQKEGRQKDDVGDSWPMLVYEINNDSVIIKWAIPVNHTPVNQRLLPNGAATQWRISKEVYEVATLKGNPTKNIDFKKWFEQKTQ